MFNFSKVESPKTINRDFILSKVSDSMLFGYYFGHFELGKTYPSRFRKDRNPSTGFYISKSGKLIYNDMARAGEKYDAFAFVAQLYKLSFSDTLKRIVTDFGLVSGVQSKEVKQVFSRLEDFDKTVKKQTRIVFKPEAWNEDNLAFWKRFSITQGELESNGIYAIKKLFINDIPISNKDNEVRYSLTLEHKGEMLTKIYCPSPDARLKWCSNIPLDVPFGLEDLKKTSDFCFVAKAQKDRIVLKKFLPVVIASQNESESALSSKLCKKLDFGYKKYIGWDCDETGITAMEKMKEKGFIPIHLPEEGLEEGIKDFADLVEKKGLKALEDFLKQNKLI